MSVTNKDEGVTPAAFVGEQAVNWLRSQPDKQELVQACYFDEPIDGAAQRFANSVEWSAVRKYLPAHKGSALDVGAGRGISSYAFARDGWHVTALEPDPSAVVGAGAIRRLVELTGTPITIVNEYGESLPFPDHSFDIVYVRQVLHHAYDLPKMCREVQRVLKAGGRFIATREHVIDRPEDLPQFFASHDLHPRFGGEHAYTLAQYQGAIQDSGLQLIKTLGPCDSLINQPPQSEAELRPNYQRKLAKRLGERLADLALNEKYPWSGLDLALLMRFGCRDLKLPGRLFSFIADKLQSEPSTQLAAEREKTA